MDNMTLIDFALSLLINVIAYLLVPTILVISRKKYKASTINKIVVINGMVVVAIFSAIKDEPAIGGFALWTAVAYWLLKKKCLLIPQNQSTPPKTSHSISPLKHEQKKHSNQIYGSDIALHKEEVKNEEPIVEQVVPPAPKKGDKPTPPKWMIVYHICLLLLVCFLAITNAIQYDRTLDYAAYIQTQQEDYNKLQEAYDELTENYKKMKDNNLDLNNELYKYKYQYQDKLDFMDEYVVFIEDDGTDWYHKYDCNRFKGNSFWALNTNAAIVDGYTPCPHCH